MKAIAKLLWICSLLLLLAGPGAAQSNKKELQLRTVHGVVSDKSETPLANSTVFLKNLRTNSVISHFSDTDGTYRFSGLDPNVDYEIHAELDGEKSPTKTVASLDGRKEIIINLKVDRKKS